MAEITAALVKDLRERTGAGMMECKKALPEAKGDIAEAEVVLRKRGIASAGKKAARATKQGLIGTYIHAGGQLGVMVEVNCESDFVARTDDFKELVHDVAMHIAAADPALPPPGRRARGGARKGKGNRPRARPARRQAGERSSTASWKAVWPSSTKRSACSTSPSSRKPPSPSSSWSRPRSPSWARTSVSRASSASRWATWRRPKPGAKTRCPNRSPQ